MTGFKDYLIEEKIEGKETVRTKQEWKDFIKYENNILELRKLVFLAGYDVTINSKNGKFDIYEYDGPKKITTIESSQGVKSWLKQNWIKE